MLISKPAISSDERRLEALLSTYEKNLRTEVFFIRRNEVQNLLELLPQQADLAVAISELLEKINLLPAKAEAIKKRLAVADALREANRSELDHVVETMKAELEELNLARVRIRQMRQISKTAYLTQEPSQLQDWA
jgi:sulfur relay (sulfurtransferase) DsrF/TusC family protein